VWSQVRPIFVITIVTYFTGTMTDITKVMSAGDAEETHSVKLGEVAEADVDVAAAYAHHLTGENAYTRKEATRLKLDLRLVPLLWFNITLGAWNPLPTRVRTPR
jgi:hypothetical protein